MAKIEFQVDKLVIAYVMQLRGIKDYGISRQKWNRLLRKTRSGNDKQWLHRIQEGLNEESSDAEKLKETIENEWSQNGKNILTWLRQLTKVDFRTQKIKVCIVPFGAGQVPFKDLPLIVVGKIRQGWGYPETIAHELAHILFNQNFQLENEVEHPYIQLIEEEIAVRLGARQKYFDYQIPDFADWVHKAQHIEKAWKHYIQHIDEFKDISHFITENERKNKPR